jgi:hypothetical protein
MNDQNQNTQTPGAAPSFFERLINNDSAKKGAAAAVAGIVVAVVQEAIWPSK